MLSKINFFNKITILVLTVSLTTPNFIFAKEPPLKLPENLQQAKEMIIQAVRKFVQEMPSVIKNIFKKDAIPIWQKMWNWIKDFWQNQIKPFFDNLWYSNLKPKIRFVIEKIRDLLNSIMTRKEKEVRKEFTKEKEEMRKDVSGIIESLWQRLKNLLIS